MNPTNAERLRRAGELSAILYRGSATPAELDELATTLPDGWLLRILHMHSNAAARDRKRLEETAKEEHARAEVLHRLLLAALVGAESLRVGSGS